MEFYDQADRRVDRAQALEMHRLGHLWIPVPTPLPLRRAIRGLLLEALAFTGGDQAAAAQCLAVSPRVLNYQLQTFDIPTARGRWRTSPRLSQRRKYRSPQES
jgi:hypothetical protein